MQHAVIEQVCSRDPRLSCVQLGVRDLAIGIDKRLLINPANTLERADVKRILAAAGDGAYNVDGEIIATFGLTTEWLRERSLNANSIGAIKAKGDSMEPTIRSNDMIGVNMSDRHPSDGLIYAIRIWDNLIIKRIHRKTRNLINLVSDNSIHPLREIDLSDQGIEFEIIGRVVAILREP